MQTTSLRGSESENKLNGATFQEEISRTRFDNRDELEGKYNGLSHFYLINPQYSLVCDNVFSPLKLDNSGIRSVELYYKYRVLLKSFALF